MTRQSVLETVVNHLAVQKQKSAIEVRDPNYGTSKNISCRYRGPKGLKCAVGAIIPDEIYDENWEGWCISGIIFPEESEIGIFSRDSYNTAFLQRLQCVHDNYPVWDWYNHFIQIAEEYSLSTKQIKHSLSTLKAIKPAIIVDWNFAWRKTDA